MTMTSTELSALGRYRDLIEPRLRAAVDSLDPINRRVCAYHLGWVDAEGEPARANGGKALRPVLALLSASAAGAPTSVGLPGAVAVELIHNFSLVHDDVMDGDEMRRNRRTVWAVWGVPTAVLAGDAMLGLATEVLLAAPRGPQAVLILQRAVRELIRGQSEDLALERRPDATLPECLSMVAGKTGALLAASSAIGAVLAGADDQLVAALEEYGRQAGMAFQLIDDVLGIWGEPEVTGKPVLSDLRSRKTSLLVAYALGRPDRHGREIARWLREPGPDPVSRLREVADVLEAAGAREWALREADRRVEQAIAALDGLSIPVEAAGDLAAVARICGRREG
jgi:geranylgeranyl diphosphate synthase type I